MTQETIGLFFPVLLKNGMVLVAQEIAEVSIPVSAQNWVYLKQLDDVTKNQ